MNDAPAFIPATLESQGLASAAFTFILPVRSPRVLTVHAIGIVFADVFGKLYSRETAKIDVSASQGQVTPLATLSVIATAP